MFSHITVGTNDLARARAFYDAILPLLGITMQHDESAYGSYGYGTGPEDTPQFWVTLPFDRRAATVGNGSTVSFTATKRAQVDAFHATALAAGGTCEGPPGLRPHYHPDYYGAYLRDRDGNKLCCVCHLPAEAAS